MKNETTSVTTHFKKLATGNNVFSVLVIVYSRLSHLAFFLHQMFNVSTLLLDDAFKPATTLTNGVINETLWQFAPLSNISQGSVATHFRCGGILSGGIIANFLLIQTGPWNNFENRLIFDEVKAYKKVPIFWPPYTRYSPYTLCIE